MTTKILTYKIARFNKEKERKSLQQLLRRALTEKKAAYARRLKGDSDNQFSLINYHGPHKGMLVGEFFDYTHGHKQPSAKFDESAESLEISSIAHPDKKSEFLSSILYFGIHENSVVLSQSTSLRSQHFEAYINWLLGECGLLGGKLDDDNYVVLADQPPLEPRKKVDGTTGIEFTAPVNLRPISHASPRSETKSIMYKPLGGAWSALKHFLPPEFTLPAELRADDILLNRSLEVTLKLSWSRQYNDDPTTLLDQISNQLRHIDDEVDYTIVTRSGKITRDEMKLRRGFSIGTTPDGLIHKLDMWEAMRVWLDELVSSGKAVVDI